MKLMLADRVNVARCAAEFCYVGTERNGKIHTVFVPGHEGKKYFVILKRDEKGLILECQHILPHSNAFLCPGGCKTVCYHQMAAVMFVAQQAGYRTAITETLGDAIRFTHLHDGATISRLMSKHAKDKVLFVVFYKWGDFYGKRCS